MVYILDGKWTKLDEIKWRIDSIYFSIAYYNKHRNEPIPLGSDGRDSRYYKPFSMLWWYYHGFNGKKNKMKALMDLMGRKTK